MRYRTLGRTGFSVSEMACGLWGMSGWSGSDDSESLRTLQLAVDLGCNFFDTAWAYGEGKSDTFLGKILAANPDKRLYSASKIPPKNQPLARAPHLRLQRRLSRRPRLRVRGQNPPRPRRRYHRRPPVPRLGRFLDRPPGVPLHRRKAQARPHRALPSASASIAGSPPTALKALRTGLVDCVQVIYNVFDQNPEDELFPLCRELNIGVIARVPLDEGSLGGKMTRQTTFPEGDWRRGYFNPKNLAETMDRVDRLRDDLPAGLSLPDAALRFILAEPAVSTIIVGMRKEEHVRGNLALSDAGPLDPTLIQKLRQHRWERSPAPWSD